MDLLLRNGRVIDPESDFDSVADVAVCDGRIVEVGPELKVDGAEVIECGDLVVAPGLIDMHVHFREPGNEEKETIRTGSRSAARGGFTSVAPMANTAPTIDTAGMVDFVKRRARESACVRVWPIAAVTRGREGRELTEFAELKEAGAVGLSDDGTCLDDSALMRHALEYAKMFDLPIISHCEDTRLSEGGMMNEGFNSTVLGLIGMPKAAEEIMVARDLLIAELTGGWVHIAHVSTARSVEMIRNAKRRGAHVTAESTPHHFALTDDAVRTFDTNAKVNPPLREQEDVDSVKEGLRDGTIDVIATDHAPHAPSEKEVEFQTAPFGIVGLETALPLVVSHLVEPRVLSLPQALSLLTYRPADILKIDVGRLQADRPADIVVFDPAAEVVVDVDKFESRGRNCPFNGQHLRCRVHYTIVGGEVIMRPDGLADTTE